MTALALPFAGCSWNWDVKGATGDGAMPPMDAGPDSDDYCVDGRRFLTIHIDANDDDGEFAGLERDAILHRDGEKPTNLPRGLYTGIWNDGRTWSYFRFTLPTAVPDEATVLSAHLVLYGLATYGPDALNDDNRFLDVYLENVRDTTVPMVLSEGMNDTPDGENHGVRDTVKTDVRWRFPTMSDFKVDGWNRSPDLSSQVKALVRDKGPLLENGHVTFWLTNMGLNATNLMELAFEDWSAEADHHARLVLEIDGCE